MIPFQNNILRIIQGCTSAPHDGIKSIPTFHFIHRGIERVAF
jgi:hypothetical protein